MKQKATMIMDMDIYYFPSRSKLAGDQSMYFFVLLYDFYISSNSLHMIFGIGSKKKKKEKQFPKGFLALKLRKDVSLDEMIWITNSLQGLTLEQRKV